MPPSEELDQPLSKTDETKLARLRAATQEALDSLDRGAGIVLKDAKTLMPLWMRLSPEVHYDSK